MATILQPLKNAANPFANAPQQNPLAAMAPAKPASPFATPVKPLITGPQMSMMPPAPAPVSPLASKVPTAPTSAPVTSPVRPAVPAVNSGELSQDQVMQNLSASGYSAPAPTSSPTSPVVPRLNPEQTLQRDDPASLAAFKKANPGLDFNDEDYQKYLAAGNTATPETPVSKAEDAYKANLGQSPEEIAAQKEIDLLTESAKKGYQDTKGQAIPMQFITGQLKSEEERATGLMEPLTAKLARLQAARTTALEASKFALDRADKAVSDAKPTTSTVAPGASVMQYDPKTATMKSIYSAPAATKTETVEADGRKLLINSDTGETIKDLGASSTGEDDNKTLSISEAKDLGVPYGTTVGAAKKMGLTPGAPAQSTSAASNQLDLVKSSIAKAENLAHASGNTGILGKAGRFLGGSDDYTNLTAETNTLRTNVLTLMTDPTIKKFFGPQMSNADVALMTAAGTTLNPELQSPENMKAELGRLKELITRMDVAVKQGTGSDNTGDAEYQAYLKAIGANQ